MLKTFVTEHKKLARLLKSKKKRFGARLFELIN
jgi:hypothetical protein